MVLKNGNIMKKRELPKNLIKVKANKPTYKINPLNIIINYFSITFYWLFILLITTLLRWFHGIKE